MKQKKDADRYIAVFFFSSDVTGGVATRKRFEKDKLEDNANTTLQFSFFSSDVTGEHSDCNNLEMM